MDCHQAYYLALLRGLTEFLPVASDSHLVLLPILLGWPGPDPAFGLATSLGALAAATIYFLDDLRAMIPAWLGSLRGKGSSPDSRLAWHLLVGSLPALLTAVFARPLLSPLSNPLPLVAGGTLLFALALWLAQMLGSGRRAEADLNWKDALMVGACQAIAPVPGASRLGLALSGSLLAGLDRRAALRFSLLLSIPVLALDCLLQGYELFHSMAAASWWHWLLNFLVSYLAIFGFIRLIERVGVLPFVLYRLALGGVLLFVFLARSV
jgi:undecaprenyl-diphosphatase